MFPGCSFGWDSLRCRQSPLVLFTRTRPTWRVWTQMKRARIAERGSSTDVVSGVEPVNGAEPSRGASDYPPRWSRISRWVRGRAGWRCELCEVKNGPSPNVLTVHHLDGNKWNLLPWNLAALCQRCHFKVQWTVDFCQANLTGVYPQWLREHVKAYNAWAQGKGRTRLALAD